MHWLLLRVAARAVRALRRPEGRCRCHVEAVPPGETRRVVARAEEMRRDVATIAEYLLGLSPTYFETLTTDELRALASCAEVERTLRDTAWAQAERALSSSAEASAWTGAGPAEGSR